MKSGAEEKLMCSKCGTTNSADDLYCKGCGAAIGIAAARVGEHTGMGIASLVLGIVSIVVAFPIFVLGILALIFGAKSYWSEQKDSYGLAGFILGFISIVAGAIYWMVLAGIYL